MPKVTKAAAQTSISAASTGDKTATITADTQRIFVVGFIEVQQASPQGDPDAGNAPRVDGNTGLGFISRAGFTRDIRNQMANRFGKPIYLQKGVLIEDVKKEILKGIKEKDKNLADAIARKAFLEKYHDSMFGAALETNKTDRISTITGWVNVSVGLSLEPVDVVQTRGTSITREKSNTAGDNDTNMYSKSWVRFAVYKFSVIFNIRAARALGLSEERIRADVEMVKSCLGNLYQDRLSETRTIIGVRALHAFYCNGESQGAFNSAELNYMVKWSRRDPEEIAMCFDDYAFDVPTNASLAPLGVVHESWRRDVISELDYRAAA